MSDPFIGEIKMTSFSFAPRGWAFCSGQFLPIAQNTALFSLLGTMYGGDGITTFRLPDLRGRAPLRTDGFNQGESAGSVSHPLSLGELPTHVHPLMVALDYIHANDPAGRVLGSVEAGGANSYHAPDGTAALHPSSLGSAGGSQPHNNLQPYLVANFIIALQGIFPSRQ